MTQATNQVAQQSIEALAAKFKALPFGTKLIDLRDGNQYLLLGAYNNSIRITGGHEVNYRYFSDYFEVPYLTEDEYEIYKREQNSLEVLYPIGTPVVAIGKRNGAVYCFKVGGHSSGYGLRSGGAEKQVGLFPISDYDFFVVGDVYTLVKGSK